MVFLVANDGQSGLHWYSTSHRNNGLGRVFTHGDHRMAAFNIRGLGLEGISKGKTTQSRMKNQTMNNFPKYVDDFWMLMFFLQQLESLDLGLPRLYQLDSAIVSWGESRWSPVVVFRPSHQKVACERGVANHIVTSVSIKEIVRWIPDSKLCCFTSTCACWRICWVWFHISHSLFFVYRSTVFGFQNPQRVRRRMMQKANVSVAWSKPCGTMLPNHEQQVYGLL